MQSNDQVLYFSSAYLSTEDWQKLGPTFKQFRIGFWETDWGEGVLYTQILCQTSSEMKQIKDLIHPLDPAFEFHAQPESSNPQNLAAVVDIRAIPPKFSLSMYVKHAVWKKMEPQLVQAHIWFENVPGVKENKILYKPKDRKDLQQILTVTQSTIKRPQVSYKIYAVAFSVKNSNLDGYCLVGTKTKKEVEALFFEKIQLLDEELESLNLKMIQIDEVMALADYESEMKETIDAEDLPKLGEVKLIDLGS